MDNPHIRMYSNVTHEMIENNSHRFHLVLLSDADEMQELWLPLIPEGYFQFSDRIAHCFLNIISINGKWLAVCKKTAFFRNVPIGQNYEIPLEDKQLLEIDFDSRTFCLYTEIVSQQQMVYHNYLVCSNVEISIGRQVENDIRYDNPYVTGKHAVLKRMADKWLIQDRGSLFGVYVNGIKTANANGDHLIMM